MWASIPPDFLSNTLLQYGHIGRCCCCLGFCGAKYRKVSEHTHTNSHTRSPRMDACNKDLRALGRRSLAPSRTLVKQRLAGVGAGAAPLLAATSAERRVTPCHREHLPNLAQAGRQAARNSTRLSTYRRRSKASGFRRTLRPQKAAQSAPMPEQRIKCRLVVHWSLAQPCSSKAANRQPVRGCCTSTKLSLSAF